jgi:hypothetical protein
MHKLLLPLLAYTALALLLTWPLVLNLSGHVPGDGIDDPALAWNLWWARESLVDQPQNPFFARSQFWPLGINLAFYTLTLTNGALGLPIQAAFGLVPAHNLLLILSFAAAGLGAYLLALSVLHSEARWARAASFVAGAFYAFASAKLFYASLGQANIASSQWIPFAMLYLMRTAGARGRLRDGAMAALFAIIQAYAELTFVSFLALFAVAALAKGTWAGIRAGPAPASVRRSAAVSASVRAASPVWARFALMGALVLAGMAPVLANMAPDLRREGDFFSSGGGFADIYSADLAGLAVPTQLHPLLGDIVRTWSNDSAPRADGSHFAVNKGQHVFLGYAALLLAGLGLTKRARPPGAWFWAACSIGFLTLALGPSLRVAGYDTGLPLPYRLLEALPFFKANRYPSRYAVMILACMTPLVAAGTLALFWRVGRRSGDGRTRTGGPASDARVTIALVAVLGLMLFEHLSVPLPLSDLGIPAVYDVIAQDPRDVSVLEAPPGWRNGARVAGKQDVIIMRQLWNGSRHGKRLYGGNTSRNPEFKFQYFSEDPTLARLIALTNASDVPEHDALRSWLANHPLTSTDRGVAERWAGFSGLGYVVVHRDAAPAVLEQELRALLPLRLVAEEGDTVVYAVEGTKPPASFLPALDSGRMILGEGWSAPPSLLAGAEQPEAVWAQRLDPVLLLPLGPGPVTMSLRLHGVASGTAVSLEADGHGTPPQPLPMGEAELRFALPADAGRPPVSRVQLHFTSDVASADVVPERAHGLPFNLLARSAGQETGDFAHIFVDGVDRSPNSRGYNLVALDPANGALLGAASFDTHGDRDASAALSAWVRALPPGAMVAGAVRDEASLQLTEEAVIALRSLGAREDLRGRFRWGHAFIGRVAGNGLGTEEAIDAVRPAAAQLGLPLTGERVAAGLREVKVEPR